MQDDDYFNPDDPDGPPPKPKKTRPPKPRKVSKVKLRRPRKKRGLVKRLFLLIFTLLLLPYFLVVLYSLIPPISLPVIGKAVTFQDVHWRWRSIDNISPSLPRAIISAEDGRFCEHNGVDWEALEKSLKRYEKRKKMKHGASTIHMQIAKNLFYWPLPTLLRKPLEIPTALWIDMMWSKQRVIEVYMNIAQFGKNVYGAEAAARYYFNKSANELNSNESARLASILPSPVKRNAAKPSKYVKKYSGSIKARAARSGGKYIACIRDEE
jgi:monofunctional glycosyltransferase